MENLNHKTKPFIIGWGVSEKMKAEEAFHLAKDMEFDANKEDAEWEHEEELRAQEEEYQDWMGGPGVELTEEYKNHLDDFYDEN